MRPRFGFTLIMLTLLCTGCTWISRLAPALQDPEKVYEYDTACNNPKVHEDFNMKELDPGVYSLNLYLAKCPAVGEDLLKNRDMRTTLYWYVMNMESRNRSLFDQLPQALKVNYFIWELEGEVNNGGYEQYFGNSSGYYKDKIVGALQIVGAYKAADITQRAITLNSKLTNNSSDALEEEVSIALYELDGEFYDVGQGDIGQKPDMYVRQNAGIIHDWMKLHAQEYLNTALPSKK